MKKYFILFIFIVLSNTIFAQKQEITKEQAIEIAKTITAQHFVNVYISKQTVAKNKVVSTMFKPFNAPDYESYMIFIDEHPLKSWGHDCKYVFVDINTGNYEIVNKKYPPFVNTMDIVKEDVFIEKGKLFHFEKNTKNFTSTDNEWAVIINGGLNSEWN